MSSDFSQEAQERWDAVPAWAQEKLLHNAWCAHCQQGTLLQLQSGAIIAGDLILSGTCARCGGKVVRLLEGESPTSPRPLQVGDEVIWLKRLPGGPYVVPIAATILGFTAKRVKIAAEDTEVGREPVVRYVPHESLQHPI